MKATLRIPFIILLFASLCMGTKGYCQHNPYKSLEVRIAPLNLFDPVTGVIQIGLQQRFNQRLALSLDYGLKFDRLSSTIFESERKDYRYYKGKAELKYFFKRGYKPLTINSPYLSSRGFICHNATGKKTAGL
jgi:hypothetical protein